MNNQTLGPEVAQAFAEFEAGAGNQQLLAQCYEDADGDASKARTLYTRARIMEIWKENEDKAAHEWVANVEKSFGCAPVLIVVGAALACLWQRFA